MELFRQILVLFSLLIEVDLTAAARLVDSLPEDFTILIPASVLPVLLARAGNFFTHGGAAHIVRQLRHVALEQLVQGELQPAGVEALAQTAMHVVLAAGDMERHPVQVGVFASGAYLHLQSGRLRLDAEAVLREIVALLQPMCFVTGFDRLPERKLDQVGGNLRAREVALHNKVGELQLESRVPEVGKHLGLRPFVSGVIRLHGDIQPRIV